MTKRFDPVLTEVMRHELVSVAEEMNITMKQTTRSIVAKEGSDFSAGILDLDGHLAMQAIPYGAGYFTGIMPNVLERFGGKFEPGDVILSNDPYGGLSHLPDIAVVMPIFWHGEHCGFGAVVQHHTDIGGRFPGGMGLPCGEIYEEGLRLRLVKYYSKGKVNEALREIIAANVRAPDDVLGDLEAGVAACRRGERGLTALFEKYGREMVEDCYQHLRAQSEGAMRAVFRSIPDGDYQTEEVFDDGAGTRVLLKLTLRIRGDNFIADFTGTGPQVKNALNVPPGMAGYGMFMALMPLLGGREVPINSGLFAPITTIAPKGSVLNPNFPAAVGSRGQLHWRVRDLVWQALAQAIPDRTPAASEGGVSMMVYSPNQTDEGGGGASMMTEMYASGWGGRPVADGVEGVMSIFLLGFRSNSGEAFERELPVMLEGFGFVPDTGGAGEYRGALSVYRRWRFLADGRVMLRTCRIDSVPYGLAGGKPGTPFKALLISNGQNTELPAKVMLEIPVKSGDVLIHVQPGAGGYGNPSRRERQRVIDDLLDEKITPAYAKREYGVTIESAG